MNTLTNASLDQQILGFCLNAEFFSQVKNTLDRDMFTREMRDIFDTIVYCHTKYGNTMSSSELSALFDDRNPAMPDSARQSVQDIIVQLEAGNPDNTDMHIDMVRNFWLRDRARQIGEKAIEIFTGESEEFGELQRLIDAVDDGRMSDKTTYTEVDTDLDSLLDAVTGDPDFPFEFNLLQDEVPGLDRGNLGILFARPEVGKTTFCCFLAASYIRQGLKVVYWANEEPADRIKLRIIQSYFELTQQEMRQSRATLAAKYRDEIAPYLTVMDSVGTSVEEADEYAKLNKPDVMFMDQLDKFRIKGDFNRSDERLKETYVYAREIAKRNKLLVWAVSQANFDAHDRQFIDYSMIIGIGKTGSSEVENTVRHICVSKNKLNGWHGMINAQIDVEKGVYY
jgi:replicative DNA helicase